MLKYWVENRILKQMASEHAQQTAILDAEFALERADAEELRQRAATITAKRKEKQPTGATCGSVFKNPTGDYAGRLI